MTAQKLLAIDHIVPSGDIVESAEALGALVVDFVIRGNTVLVDFSGLRGASPSYFTVFLQCLQDGLQGAFPGPNVDFKFDTQAQTNAFHRSFDTIVKN